MEKSLKVHQTTNEIIDTIVATLRRRFPRATHINKKGVMQTAIARYYQFLSDELNKKQETTNS